MDKFLNYIFIGFAFSFILDFISDKYADHPSYQNVPEWSWGARIMLILFWPLGAAMFIYVYLKEYFK